MSEAVVSGVRRLSTISETDVDREVEPVSMVSSGDSEWVGSSASLCSRGKPSAESSNFTSFESYQPDTAGTASMLLCLHDYLHVWYVEVVLDALNFNCTLPNADVAYACVRQLYFNCENDLVGV